MVDRNFPVRIPCSYQSAIAQSHLVRGGQIQNLNHFSTPPLVGSKIVRPWHGVLEMRGIMRLQDFTMRACYPSVLELAELTIW